MKRLPQKKEGRKKNGWKKKLWAEHGARILRLKSLFNIIFIIIMQIEKFFFTLFSTNLNYLEAFLNNTEVSLIYFFQEERRGKETDINFT